MYCHQCAEPLDKYSPAEIEQLSHRASCPKCQHYNPVEGTSCIKCGFELHRDAGVMVRDVTGRLSIMRETSLSKSSLVFVRLALVFVLYGIAALTWKTIVGVAYIETLLFCPLGFLFIGTWGLLVAFALYERRRGPTYQLKACFALFMVLFVGLLFIASDLVSYGPGFLNFWLLYAFLAVLLYCELFIVWGRTRGDFSVVFISFLGLYASIAPLLTLFGGGGFLECVRVDPNLVRDLQWFLGPSFIGFHVFLPYCFLLMLGRSIGSYQKSFKRVDGKTTIVYRFINRRKEAVRGVLFDLFAVGVLLYVGFYFMGRAEVPNVLTIFNHWFYSVTGIEIPNVLIMFTDLIKSFFPSMTRG